MKMTLHDVDEEIRHVENRIELERIALDDAIAGCTNSLRNTVASPKTLLAVTGIGFAVGKVMFGRKAQPAAAAPAKAGILGLLTGVAGTAISLMRPGFGAGTVARWAAAKVLARHKAKAKAPAPAAGARPAHPRAPTTVPQRTAP